MYVYIWQKEDKVSVLESSSFCSSLGSSVGGGRLNDAVIQNETTWRHCFKISKCYTLTLEAAEEARWPHRVQGEVRLLSAHLL